MLDEICAEIRLEWPGRRIRLAAAPSPGDHLEIPRAHKVD